MNFLPEDYVEKRQATRAAIVFIGLLLFVVTGVVGTYLYMQWSMKGVFAQRDHVNLQYEEASKKIAEAQEMEKQKERMVEKAEVTTALMERVRRSALLGELTRLLPQGVRFASLDLKTKEMAQPAGANPNAALEKARQGQGGKVETPKAPLMDVTLILTGIAPTDSDVATYMSSLQHSDLLTGVALLYSEELKKNKDDQPVRRFSVEMHVDPNADLRESVVSADRNK